MGPHPLPPPPCTFPSSAPHQGAGSERLRYLSWRRSADAPGIQSEQCGPHGVLYYLSSRAEGVEGLLGMSLLTARSAVILSRSKDLAGMPRDLSLRSG